MTDGMRYLRFALLGGGDVEVVKLLLAHGSNPTLPTVAGAGAFGRPADPYPETAALLKKLMADTGSRGAAR
ncbi:MAG TPA: hypothetical protein VGM84_14510 [Steroidobacteraceae bacterium]